jgi:hypothetical protein
MVAGEQPHHATDLLAVREQAARDSYAVSRAFLTDRRLAPEHLPV